MAKPRGPASSNAVRKKKPRKAAVTWLTDKFVAIDRTLSQLSACIVFWTMVCANLFMLGWVLVALAMPREGAFVVDAQTEVLSVTVAAGVPLSAKLDQARVLGPALKDCTAFAFYKVADRPIELELVRRGGSQWLLARIVGGPKQPIGVYECSGTEKEAIGSVLLDPFSGVTPARTLTLQGDARLGQLPDSGAEETLLSGTVTASAWSLPFRSARAIETSALMMGDEIRLYPDPGNDRPVSGTTVVRLDKDGEGFRVLSHAVASLAEVKRPGVDSSTPIAIAPSLWSRFQAQSEWPVILLAVALFLNMFTGLRHYSDVAREAKKDQK